MGVSFAESASGGAARRSRRGVLTNISTYKVAVYNTLREEIKTLELQPGERLVEELLSDRFGISKTPIREALLLLESDHLIELIPHVGGAVTWMSLAEYEQELFLLDSLELPALELVAERATEGDMARWDAAVVDIRRLSRSEEILDYRTHVAELHGDIFGVSGYPRLVGIISLTQMLLCRYSVLFIDQDPSKKSRERELEIVTMRVRHLRNRDASAAAAVVRRRHADQLKRAKERVAAGDPLVMPYLAEGQ